MSEKSTQLKIDELLSSEEFKDLEKQCSSKRRLGTEEKISPLYDSAQDYQTQLIQLKKDLLKEFNACKDTIEKDSMRSTARKRVFCR